MLLIPNQNAVIAYEHKRLEVDNLCQKGVIIYCFKAANKGYKSNELLKGMFEKSLQLRGKSTPFPFPLR